MTLPNGGSPRDRAHRGDPARGCALRRCTRRLTSGIIGDILSARLKANGATAAVIHGVVRDSPYIAELGLPVFSAGIHPAHSGRDLVPVDFDRPIEMAGVQVEPGDILLADDEGIVAMPLDLAEYIASHGPPKEPWRNGFVARSLRVVQSMTTTHRCRKNLPSTSAKQDGATRESSPTGSRGNRVKIRDIRTAEIRGHGYSTYVRIYTDEGLIGNGECIHGGEGCPAMVQALAQYLIGEDPLNVDMLFEKMRRSRLFDGAMAGATVTAMTGIEIALWDLAGKMLGVPVYQLLGGKFRDTVRLYCDSHAGSDFSPEAYAERAREVVALGFDALKFDVDETETGFRNDKWNWHASGDEIHWMVERVAAVREAVGPSIDLAIDMHGRYDIASGIAVARAMEPFGLLWLEEPVPPENVAAMREVRRSSPVPLCAGENLYLRWGFRDLLEQQAVDFIMPDIPKCGGLSECRKIANMAEVYYVPLAPHNVCGPLGTMASAHVCASIPNFLVLEWHWIDYEGWDELTIQDQPVIQDGHVVLTSKPGIGLEVNDDVARRFVRPGTLYFGEQP